MKYNFDEIKKKISLCDFLVDNYGWTYDEGSSARSVKLKSPENGDVIVISKSAKGWDKYFTVHDDTIKGATIFDWMANHIEQETGKRPNLYKIAQILQDYIDKGKTVLPKDYNEYRDIVSKNASEDVNKFLNEVKQVRPMKDFSFLKSRGIKRETLSDTIWKDIFRQKDYTDQQGKTYTNTAILMYNKDGVAGISQRGAKDNKSFKGALGSRADSLANTRVLNSEPIVFIGESLIDCISHYQMAKEHGRDVSNFQYLSTEGQITEGQINLVKGLFSDPQSKLKEAKQFIPIFDNDPAGQSYTLKLLGNISDDAYKYTAQVSNDRVHIQFFTNSPTDTEILFPKRIFEKYTDNFSIEVSHTFEKAAVYNISFPFEREILKELNQHLGEIQLGRKFSMEIPVTKDFNDDLKAGYYKTPKEQEQEIKTERQEEKESVRIEETVYVAPLTKEEIKMGTAELEKRINEIVASISDLDDRRKYYEREGEFGMLGKVTGEILPLQRELSELETKMSEFRKMEQEESIQKTTEVTKENEITR